MASKDRLPHHGRALTPAGKLGITLALSVALMGMLTIVAPAAQKSVRAQSEIPVTTLTTLTTLTDISTISTIDPTTITTLTDLTTKVTTLTTVSTISLADFLRINIKGPGKVAVGGTNCGETTINTPDTAAPTEECVKSFPDGVSTAFSVTASPIAGDDAQFVRWESAGACNNLTSATCNLTISNGFTLTAVFQDNTAPVPTIGGTASPVVTESVDGNFSVPLGTNAADPSVTFQCAVDASVVFAPCTSPFAVTNPSDGTHTLKIKATDPSGTVSGQVSKEFILYTLPQTTINGGPTGLVNNSTAQFTFVNSKPSGTVLCKLDAAPSFTGCPPDGRFTGLSQGAHTLQARAQQDFNGVRVDPTPASRSWTVDTVAPNTTVTDGPSDGLLTNRKDTSFTFTAEPGALFECTLDGVALAVPAVGAFGPCPGGIAGKALFNAPVGAHTFGVRAKDAAGNLDPTPAERSWTVVADDDGDGHVVPADCNDGNPSINPAAADIPENGVDENCDGKDAVKPPVDADGDGHFVPADCNDNNAKINPAATDIPDNGVDENCKDGDAVGPVIPALVTFNFKAGQAFTVLKTLALKNVPAGSTVTGTCKAPKRKKGCPKRFSKTNAAGTVNIKSFTNRRLPAGSVLQIRVSHAGMTTLVKVLKLRARRGPAVSTLCIRSGQTKPGACPSSG